MCSPGKSLGSEPFNYPRWSPDARYIAAVPDAASDKVLLFDLATQK